MVFSICVRSITIINMPKNIRKSKGFWIVKMPHINHDNLFPNGSITHGVFYISVLSITPRHI